MRLLNRAELGVLIGRREAGEIAEHLETFAVGLAGTCFALVAVLRIGLDPRSPGVAVLVAAVRAGELAVDVNDDVGLGRSRTARVARENAGTGGRDHPGFLGGEKAQRSEERRVGEEGRFRWGPDH